MNEKRDLITSRNLLAGLNCSVCNCSVCKFQYSCISKLKESHNTCSKCKPFDRNSQRRRVIWTPLPNLAQDFDGDAEQALINMAGQELKNAIDKDFFNKVLSKMK